MNIFIALATVVGALTMYTADMYGGGVLYCDTACTDLTYRDDLQFIAAPVGMFEPGGWECGDWVRVQFDSGESFWAQVLDAGPFDRFRVEELDAPIVADVPEHLWPIEGDISAPGRVFNESFFNRLSRDMQMDHLRRE